MSMIWNSSHNLSSISSMFLLLELSFDFTNHFINKEIIRSHYFSSSNKSLNQKLILTSDMALKVTCDVMRRDRCRPGGEERRPADVFTSSEVS